MAYADPEQQRASARRRYELNREAMKARTKAYALAHPEMVRRHSLARKGKRSAAQRALERAKAKGRRGFHDGHVLLWRKQPKQPQPKPMRQPLHDAHVRRLRDDDALYYAWRYRTDPEFMLRERTRTSLRKIKYRKDLDEAMRQALKGMSSGKGFATVVGYTVSDLRKHLERQFDAGMSWDGFSRDGWHVDHILPRRLFDLSTAEGLRACWALSNLRPLAAARNLAKGGRVETLC